MHSIDWSCKTFDTLTPSELYAIIRLRNAVFVVEQHCVFQDADDKDQYCHHLAGVIGDDLAAYARIVPAGVSYPHISIGRVITAAAFRRAGLGKALMERAIHECQRLYGKQPIQIGAQQYLKDFYQSFGFQQTSNMYLEDDIPHIEMLRQ
jgi:ElaA protein